MYKNGRIIIDTRTYMMDDVFGRYKRQMLIFGKEGLTAKAHKNKKTWEILKALSRGIPFPPVYVSELQTGELLVLDKSDRLRFLMEYLDYGFEGHEEFLKIQELGYGSERDFLKDIFYSSIILHVIDYMNPRYMHMQVGAFIEEWPVTQEQSIRNVLYRGEAMEILDKLAAEINGSPKMRLTIQYCLIYFIMVYFVMSREFDAFEYRNADRFQLLEETIDQLKYKDHGFLRNLCEQFAYLYRENSQKEGRGSSILYRSPEEKMKYLCFMGAWMQIGGLQNPDGIFGGRKIKKMVMDCDMGYQSISRILENFRRGDL